MVRATRRRLALREVAWLRLRRNPIDRQNVIIGAIALVALVAVGAFVFWPESGEQAATVTTEPAATAEDGATSSESGGY